jgi:hypothetical protein
LLFAESDKCAVVWSHCSTISSKFPSIVTFYSDCATYKFWHPYETKEISMVMHYGDMSHATLAARQRRFTFRINRDLGAASGIDCDSKP